MRLFEIKDKILKWKGLPYAVLGALVFFSCWFFVGRYGVFGAKVDWLSQHSVFPDYFRQQFYETKNLIPEFAGNIGGGQNIYNFAYYGLYNPVIMISYLFPFIKMSDYLMAAGVLELLASVWLMYYWLGRRGFSREIRLSAAILFLLAGPMIYHFCHQVMFVNYMPFLCLALLGVDRHFEQGRSGLYTISVFLMIMTSFYFSIGGILVLVLYGTSRYLELKESHVSGRPFLFPIFTAILMSSILLIPTALSIMGRQGESQAADIGLLFIPDIQILRVAYSGYGIGLTTLAITVLITGLTYRKWHERVLTYGCVLIFIIPVFAWLLNGGLYVRSKVMIPFLPLLCYLIAVYLEKQKNREISFGINITAYILTLVMLYYGHYSGAELSSGKLKWCVILMEGLFMLVCFLIFWKYKRLSLLIVPSILCLFLAGSLFYSGVNEVMDKEFYFRITDTRTGEMIHQTLNQEKGLYRLEQSGREEEKAANLNRIWDSKQWISSIYSSAYNAEYQNFRKNVFQLEESFRNDLMQAASDNPLYQKLMGVKYLVDGEQVHENEDAAPIIYATDKVISEENYKELPFPYNQTALMEYAVVKSPKDNGEEWDSQIEKTANPVDLPFPELNKKDIKVEQISKGIYHIRADVKTKVKWIVAGEENQQEKLLYVQFHVKNNKPNQDVAIWLDGTRNKLSADNHIYYNGNTTFSYVTIMKKGQTEEELVFGAGDYEISDIKCFLGDTSILEDSGSLEDAGKSKGKLYQSEFQPDFMQTKGNQIYGTIQVKNTGYCITSIPYDPNYEILVDGKKVISEKVNTAFLGFPVMKGNHQIKIIYHAPGVKTGKILTCLGILLWILIMMIQKLSAKQKKCRT